MKVILIIAFFLSTGIALTQEWRDSLEVARREYKKHNYEKALRYYKSAQSKAPEDIDLSDEIGQSSYKSGDYETAEKVYQQNSGNKSSNKSKAENNHNIGNSRMRSKNYAGAVDAYKESLRLNPRDEKTRYNLSEAQRKLKNKQEKENKNSQENKEKPAADKNQKPDEKGDSDGNPNDSKPRDQKEKPKPSDQKKGGNKDRESNNSNSSKLSDKTIEKKLDELMKKEAETKKRIQEYGQGGTLPKSRKDW